MNVCHHHVALKLKIIAQTSKDLTHAPNVIRDICCWKENVWVCTQHKVCDQDCSMFAWWVLRLSFTHCKKSVNE